MKCFLSELAVAAERAPILDLACGGGRNGLYLIAKDIPVVFADIKSEALAQVQLSLAEDACEKNRQLATLWPVDFEQPDINPFDDRAFGGIIVYNYLCRTLFENIQHAVYPDGLVIYETFTVDQVRFGRPQNPDFLLHPDELREHFCDWHVLHYYEGVVKTGTGLKAVAQLVARKPASPPGPR